MRNLKRALSLALASVMLLGMMVTGAGAASNSFTDFDQIVNQEAAEVTSGLGIFDGYTDGSFGPENVVTRAEMAVIICKLLNGSDVDPGNFTDIDTFDDVPAWAEGYVNYCASMGIVVGVGERKFNPSATVSTVEAATMLLKALGYFIEEDQLGADWKTVVTGRATSLKLYGALTLGVDEGLTRDNVAELLFHTLFAQRVAYDDNRHLYVKNTDRDVVVTNGTEDKNNTFAMNTFGMWYVDGVVTANSYTENALSEAVNNAPRTEVVFDAPTDMGTGPVASYPFEYTTNVDMIGHAARTYYAIERRAPVVYAIVDRATKTEYITFNGNTTRLADAANNLGFRKNTILQIPSNDYKVNYSWDSTVGTLANTDRAVNLTGPDISKTLLVISNSSDYTVDCVIVLDQYLDTVNKIIEQNETKKYDLTTFDGDDQNIALDEVAEKDYAVITDVGNLGNMLLISAPELVEASISKISGVSNASATVKAIVADGTEYVGSPVAHHKSATYNTENARSLDNTTNFERIETIGEATLILDFQGKCIGLGEPESDEVFAYVAQYATRHVDGFGTEMRLVAKLYLSDGTSGVYPINTSAGTASTNSFKDYKHNNGAGYQTNENTLNGKPLATPSKAVEVYDDTYFTMVKSDGTPNGNGLGVFKASVRADGSVVLAKLSGQDTKRDDADHAIGAAARAVVGHSTLIVTKTYPAGNMNTIGGNVTSTADSSKYIYQTNKTVFFYVNGSWGTNGDTLDVVTRTGIENMAKFIHGENSDDNNDKDEFVQVFSELVVDRRQVKAEMIYGLEVGASNDVVLYDQGRWHTTAVSSSKADGKLVTLTYDVYDLDGELKQITYDNDGKYYEEIEAKQEAADKPTGYYTIGKDTIQPVAVFHDKNSAGEKHDFASSSLYPDDNKAKLKKNVFVINAIVDHVDFENNIFTKIEDVGGITKNAIVKDLTNNSYTTFTSAQDIQRACDAGNTVKISYCYDTSGNDAYKVKVVFVTGFEPKGTNVVVDSKDPSKAVLDEKFNLITVDAVDGKVNTGAMYNALTAAGYYIVNYGSTIGTVNYNTAAGSPLTTITVASNNNSNVGWRMFNVVLGEKYWTISIDGKVAQYVKQGEKSKEIDFTKISTKGGTGYVIDKVYTTSDPAGVAVNYNTYDKKLLEVVVDGDSSKYPVEIKTGYVKVDTAGDAPASTPTYTEVGKDLVLKGNAGDIYSYTINNQTRNVAGNGKIPAAQIVNDITFGGTVNAASVIVDGTAYSVNDARNYVANLANRTGTGLLKGTDDFVAYDSTVAPAGANTFMPAVGETYKTGYVGVSKDSGSTWKAVEANKKYTVAKNTNNGSGWEYILQNADKTFAATGTYAKYGEEITVNTNVMVKRDKIQVTVNGANPVMLDANAALVINNYILQAAANYPNGVRYTVNNNTTEYFVGGTVASTYAANQTAGRETGNWPGDINIIAESITAPQDNKTTAEAAADNVAAKIDKISGATDEQKLAERRKGMPMSGAGQIAASKLTNIGVANAGATVTMGIYYEVTDGEVVTVNFYDGIGTSGKQPIDTTVYTNSVSGAGAVFFDKTNMGGILKDGCIYTYEVIKSSDNVTGQIVIPSGFNT